MTAFSWELIAIVFASGALVFGALWLRATRLVRAREALWRASMQMLQSGQYSDVQALAARSEKVLPEGAMGEITSALQAVARDVKQHETARRELEDVLSSLQDAVLVVDAEARLRFVNAPALQLFGVRVEDVLGAQLLEALPSFGLDSSVRIALQEGRSTMREQSLYFTSAPHAAKIARRGQIAPSENAQFSDEGTKRDSTFNETNASSTRNATSASALASASATSVASNTGNETNGNAANANENGNGNGANRDGNGSHHGNGSATSTGNGAIYHNGASDARREILMRVSPVRSSLGKVAGAVAILQDLTEMRRLERVRRDFVANASHELRTPIANIRAGAETILTDPSDVELARRFLPQIVTESERLSRLVSDLLDLAHADAALETPRAPVNFCAVIDAVVERLQEKATQNGVQVTRDYNNETEACVAGDFASLEQIVFNLLDNALIYTPSGGKVELSVRVLDAPRELVFTVSDTGIGIPGDDQERVFERFYRVDKARSRAQGGTGLGLAIVKHIVENHNGSVSVQSAVDNGTIFVVRLPAL